MTMQDPALDDVEATRRRLVNAMRTGVAQNPDQLARDRADAAARGVSVQTLRAARDMGLPVPAPEVLDLPNRAPRAAEFLSNPAVAAVAHDDVESMSAAETLLRGVSARALNLGAGLARTAATAANPITSTFEGIADRLGVPRYTIGIGTGGIDVRRQTATDNATTQTRAAISRGEDAKLGYEAMTTWEDVKKRPLAEFIPFALETGIVSAPDMAAAVLNLPAYLAARTGEIGQDRAENNGSADATVGDLAAALPAAAVSSLLERIGTRGVLGLDDAVRGGARGILPAAGRAGVKEAITEAGQGVVEYAGSNLGTEAGFDPATALDQALAGAVAGGPFGATVRGVTAGIEVGVASTQRGKAEVQQSEAGGQVIDRLNAIAEASVLRERDPQTFQEFVDMASEGTPAENVYIEAAAFAQAAGPNLPNILNAVPELKDQMDGALASGGDLRISTGAFAAHIAGTDFAQPMLEHLKVDPFDMSRAQAKEFLTAQAEELKGEVERAVAAGQMDETWQASAGRVRDNLTVELEKAGRFSPDVNSAYAAVVSNFYATTAARLGITPEQMAERYPLRVTGELPGARANTMDQSDTVELIHFSPVADLVETDPMAWGRNAVATSRDERQRTPIIPREGDTAWTPEALAAANATRGPGRTYFYDRGVRGDTPETSIGKTSPNAYTTSIPRSRLYDFDADPQNLRPTDGTPAEQASLYEQAIKAAGFAGYTSNARGVLGGVAVFEPMAVQPWTEERAYAQAQAAEQPLTGAPKANVPSVRARRAAEAYMASAGLPYNPPTEYVKVDPDRAKRIADTFEAMQHDPENPEVKAAYRAMIDETLAQWQAIKATGLKVEFITGDDPYAATPRLAILDVVENNHLWVFPTDAGFGSSDLDVSDNPLLEMTGEFIDGKELRANDVFRIVHDYFGHIKDGNGFRADGEENAWQSHAAMYSPLARRAMTTETRGQNSWVNFGPHAGANKTASAADTVYADQKIGLLPEWVSTEGFLGGASYAQAEPFFSALLRAVENSPTAKAPAAQWKATLAKTAGVKKEEIEWSGVNEWLDALATAPPPNERGSRVLTEDNDGPWADISATMLPDAKGNISKEAVLEFLRNGGVQVEERLLTTASADAYNIVEREFSDGRYFVIEDENGEEVEMFDTREQAQRLIDRAVSRGQLAVGGVQGSGPVQFQAYKLPGADDTYREILLTLPNIEGPSTHWDEPNVVAHARVTMREDASGARVLFLEELQSDWHQKGRDEGYQTAASPEQVKAAEDAYADADDALRAVWPKLVEAAQASLKRRAEFYGGGEGAIVSGAVRDAAELQERNARSPSSAAIYAYNQLNAERQSSNGGNLIEGDIELLETYNQVRLAANEARQAMENARGERGIPDAPFRTSWSALLMKRMIRYAVDNGAEKVAWINGNQQNGGQTGGDGSFFYERNLVNVANDLVKKYGARVEPVDFRPQPFDTDDADDVYTDDADRARGEATRAMLDAGRDRPANKLGIQNGFTITDQMREAARGGFALFQQNRGQIAFGGDISQTPTVISLLRTADLSTFLHETGHFFLEVSTHIANQPDAPADILADLSETFRWFGDGVDLARWNTMTPDERRPYHEKFARGFEAYLFEGRAPSIAMRGLFRRFSAWLKNVYKSLTALNVDLTDEVRSVFDRMLASAEDIRATEQARTFAPLMAEKPETMSTDEWTRYQELGIEATQEAIETLEQRNLRDMQWASNAKSRALKRLQRDAEEQRKVVRAEVTAEVMAEPVNRARNFLRRGLGENGETMEGAAKLDLDALKAQYGEDHPWTQLRRGGKYGEVATGGLLPDVVADMFGYPTGEALIADLVNGENAQEKIAGLTDQRMLERYGDLSSPEALERAANEAVANDARLKFVAAESAALSKAVGKRSLLNEAAREYAASVVNRLVLKRLRPSQYIAAQGRAAKEAERAFRKGDLAAAATAKRNQLINLHTGKAVQDAQREVEKGMRLFKRIVSANNDALSKSRNMDLVNAARAILAMYGMGRVKNDPASYMKALSQYDPTLFADLQPFIDGAKDGAAPMENITYEQFVGLRDTVNQLWTLARRSRQVEIDGQLMDRQTITEALEGRLVELGAPRQAGLDRAPTDRDQRDRDLLGVRAALRRVESWARGIDGADQGPFRRFIWNPISEASDRYRAASGEYVRQFRDLLNTVRDELKPRDIAAPEIGYTFGGKAELYHALLHTGNGSNKSKLLLGRRWGKRNAEGELDSSRWDSFVDRLHAEGVLTAKDWNFVQAVWDLLETTKPGAQKAHRTIYGRYFDEIAADPVETPFGTLRGGYVPALTDAFLVQDAVLRAEQEAVEGGDSAMFPAASNGFTKSRVEDYTRELALDLRLLPMHIDKVLKFTHLGPPVRDVARILKDRKFSATLQAFDPTAATDLLLPWLQRAAKQIVETPSKGRAGKAADRFFSAVRSRVGMQLMFANVVNTAQQVTGFSNVMLRVRPAVLGDALWRFTRDPKGVSEQAAELSVFLRNRMSTDIFEARQTITQLAKLNPSVKDQAVDFVTRHAYFMQSAVQNVMDVISWTGAYDQATARGDSQAEAIRFADSVIRETQGSMAPEDVSRFETGQPFMRMFTQFAGYFNMMANLNATEVQQVARDVGFKKGAGRLFYVYLMGFAVPALLGDAIAKALRGGWSDEDEDGSYMDDLFTWFFSSQARFALAAVPVAGQIGNAAIGTTTGQPYDDRLSISPAVSVVESSVTVPREVYQAIFEGEAFNRTDTRNVLNLLGIVTGTPAGALSKPVGYGVGVAQGDIEPTGPLDAARGVVTGSPSPESRAN